MALKVTKSEDGTMRATIRVGFRIACHDVATAILYAYQYEEADEALSEIRALTRAKAIALTRKLYHLRGNEHMAIGEDAAEEVISASSDQAARLFPEFEAHGSGGPNGAQS